MYNLVIHLSIVRGPRVAKQTNSNYAQTEERNLQLFVNIYFTDKILFQNQREGSCKSKNYIKQNILMCVVHSTCSYIWANCSQKISK